MGLMRKKDEEQEEIEGIDIIEAGDEPEDDEFEAGFENEFEEEPDDEPEDLDGEDPEDMEEDEPEDEPLDEGDIYEEGAATGPRSKGLYLGLAVAIAAIALIVGYIAGSGTGSSSVASSDSSTTGVSSAYITDDELDAVVATWTYDGVTYSVTAQEAIESQYSLEAVMQDDGTYPVATADVILSYVRNQVLLVEAEAQGLSVTEDEVAAYAESTLGSSDYEYISETYDVTEEQAEEIVTQMALIQALYDSVMPELDVVMPDAPAEPDDDADEDVPTEEYAAYIIGLLGDEWDTENDTWATTDGDYYAMLGDEDFSSEGATYNQAITAYYVAYLLYTSAYSEAATTWTAYASELYGAVELTIYGLYA